MNNNNTTKIQHFVPQFYLRNFENKKTKMLCCYNKDSLKYHSSRPKDVCQGKFLYETAIEVDGKVINYEENLLEKAFSKKESIWNMQLKNLLDRIKNKIKNRDFKNIATKENRDFLDEFCANLMSRNPYITNNFCTDSVKDDDFKKFIDDNQSIFSVVDEETRDKIIDHSIRNFMMNPIKTNGWQRIFSSVLNKLTVSFAYSPKGKFITSDTPTILITETGSGYNYLYLPLSPNYAVIYSKGEIFSQYKNKIKVIKENAYMFNSEYVDFEYTHLLIANDKKIIEETLEKLSNERLNENN